MASRHSGSLQIQSDLPVCYMISESASLLVGKEYVFGADAAETCRGTLAVRLMKAKLPGKGNLRHCIIKNDVHPP